MARKYKCPVCEKMNSEEESILYKKRRYCSESDCLDRKKEEDENKDSKNDDWVELYEYITELYGKSPTGMMYKQLGEYRKEPFNYTNKGMYLTLKYFYETLGNTVINGTGLGIIPYVYEDAKKNFIENMEINSYNDEFELNEKPKLIVVHDNFNGNRRMKNSLINFDEIDDEE